MAAQYGHQKQNEIILAGIMIGTRFSVHGNFLITISIFTEKIFSKKSQYCNFLHDKKIVYLWMSADPQCFIILFVCCGLVVFQM